MMSKVMGLQTVAPHLFLYLNSSPSYAYKNAQICTFTVFLFVFVVFFFSCTQVNITDTDKKHV